MAPPSPDRANRAPVATRTGDTHSTPGTAHTADTTPHAGSRPDSLHSGRCSWLLLTLPTPIARAHLDQLCHPLQLMALSTCPKLLQPFEAIWGTILQGHLAGSHGFTHAVQVLRHLRYPVQLAHWQYHFPPSKITEQVQTSQKPTIFCMGRVSVVMRVPYGQRVSTQTADGCRQP